MLSEEGCPTMLSESEILPYHFLLQYTPIFIDENGCWFHKRNVNKQVYQKLLFNGKRIGAHVLSANLFCEHDRKLLACHHCDVPACFNPTHLFSGTHQDNMHDAFIKGKQFRVEKQIRESFLEITGGFDNWASSVFTGADLTFE